MGREYDEDAIGEYLASVRGQRITLRGKVYG